MPYSSTTAHASGGTSSTANGNNFGIAANKIVQTSSDGTLIGSNNIVGDAALTTSNATFTAPNITGTTVTATSALKPGTGGQLVTAANVSDGVVGSLPGDVVMNLSSNASSFWVGASGSASNRALFASKDQVTVFSTTDSTTSANGAFVSNGGIGCQKALNIGGKFNTADTTNATSAATGSITSSGGISCAQDAWVGGSLFLPTSGGTPTGLNVYEVVAFSTTFSGAFTSGTINCVLLKIGRLCAMFWPGFSGTATSGAKLTAGTAIPSRFLPSEAVYMGVPVKNNSVTVEGTATLTGLGNLQFSVIDANFTGSGTAGPLGGGCITWISSS